MKVYWPYIPSALALILTIGLVLIQPRTPANVLAYATGISPDSLLSETNQQRLGSGVSELVLNSKLNEAAQAKAEDMALRDYWSHATPEGEDPWIFIDNTGYKYLKAGENLAYGFATSADTVAGWMNSPTHKANLLDIAYSEVGFGFANAPDYQDNGPETIVVAMYAKPEVKAAVASPLPSPAQTVRNEQEPPPVKKPPASADSDETVTSTSAAALSEPPSKQIVLAQTITGGRVPWIFLAVGIVAGSAATALLLRHGLKLRHLLLDSEKLILHHPVIDTGLILILVISIGLSQGVGVIR